MSDHSLHLFDARTNEEVGIVESTGLDVFFPPEVGGWSNVLDCREEPYTETSIAENCKYALRVHKKYILVEGSQIAQEKPISEEAL